jgi:glucan biosynthesis protein C
MSMSISKPSHNNARLDYLDAVRSFALILGIIFHASLSFLPIFIGWAVMDISTSSFVSVFIMINHSFRMALFFLIAGFFSHMKFHQQGVQSFLKSRLVRIALPFIIGWFLLKPLIISAWIMGAESMRGDVDILNGLVGGFASLETLSKYLLIGTHLWFANVKKNDDDPWITKITRVNNKERTKSLWFKQGNCN